MRDDSAAALRDPIDAVKAALDGTPSPPKPPPPAPPRRPPAAADHRGGPPPAPKPSFRHQINWKWVRRGLYVAVAALIVLPIVTFAMAYLIVDVPKPGDIRTNQVSTILASDGSETRENRSARRQSRRRQHRPDSGARAQRGDGRRGP